MRLALVTLVLATSPPESGVALSAEDVHAVRELLGAVVREVDPERRARLAQEAARFDGADLAELAAAVRLGPVYPDGLPEARRVGGARETLERYGSVVTGYAFEHEGHLVRYAVDVPADYDSQVAHPVLLDPGHGSGAGEDQEGKAGFLAMYRRHADAAGGADWLVVRTEIVEAFGASGPLARAEDEVLPVFDAFLRDLAGNYHVDPARIYVTGVSQTGFWAWLLGRARADRFAGIAPTSAVTWQVDRWHENFVNLPTYVLHGSADGVCPVAQPRATCAGLMSLDAPVRYDEVSGGAHDYAVWQHLPRALAWLAAHPRADFPRRVSKSLGSDAAPGGLGGWCHWLRADRWKSRSNGSAARPPSAGIDGELDGQTIRLYSEDVEGVTLALASAMLDLDAPVTVVWNGATVHAGAVERSAVTMLALAGERADWSVAYEATLTLRAP